MRNIILLLISIFHFTICTSAQNKKEVTGFYSGKLGKNIFITLSLKQSGNEVKGYYHYNKNNIDIRLQGRVTNSGTIDLEEYGFFEITGDWKGELKGDQFYGTWTSGDKKRKISFLCSKIIMQGLPGEQMSSKAVFSAVEIELPKFEIKVPRDLASMLFNKMIEDGVIDVDNEYTKDVLVKGKNDPSVLFIGESIDLNNDNVHELVVYPSGAEGACISHNCPFWIYKKKCDSYQQILNGIAGIFGYKILNISRNNFNDIALIHTHLQLNMKFMFTGLTE